MHCPPKRDLFPGFCSLCVSSLLAASERFDILPYEEMALYYPQANQKRPLILVGPPSIGRHELRLRLLEDTSRFAAAVPRKYSITWIIYGTITVHTGLKCAKNDDFSLWGSTISFLDFFVYCVVAVVLLTLCSYYFYFCADCLLGLANLWNWFSNPF